MSIRNVVHQPSVSYLTMILLAAFGWAVVHVIDKLNQAPIVEYSVNWSSSNNFRTVEIRLENLSQKIRFWNLEFMLIPPTPENGKFSSPDIIEVPPAYTTRLDSDGNIIPDDPEVNNGSVTFRINAFQPGEVYTLKSNYSGKDSPLFLLGNSANEIRLLERSLITFLVKFELLFIGLFALVSLVSVSALLYFNKNNV